MTIKDLADVRKRLHGHTAQTINVSIIIIIFLSFKVGLANFYSLKAHCSLICVSTGKASIYLMTNGLGEAQA